MQPAFFALFFALHRRFQTVPKPILNAEVREMRVYGEAFLFINGWMDFLCLLLAARLGKSRFNAGKALISAGFGAVYAVPAWSAGMADLRSVPILLLVCLGMARIAFGRRGLRLFPLIAAAGWFLSGLSDFVLKSGGSPASVIWIDSGAAVGILLLTRRICILDGVHYGLRMAYRGQTAVFSALLDTGNLLIDSVSGLPVIILSQGLAKPFLPPGTDLNDLSTLPQGWRLVRAKTAAGSGTFMCFSPDQIVVRQGKHSWKAEALIAVSGFEERYALLPASLFSEPKEGMCHAVL